MKKLELVNRNAETLYEAYGLSEKEFDSIVESFLEKVEEIKNKNTSSNEINEFLEKNKKEAIIAFVVNSDPRAIGLLAKVLEETEEIKVENVIDLIEVLDCLKLEDALSYMVKTQIVDKIMSIADKDQE